MLSEDFVQLSFHSRCVMTDAIFNIMAVDDNIECDPLGMRFPCKRLLGGSISFLFFCFCHSNESNQRQSNMFASSVTMRYVFLSVNPFTNDPSLSITHTHTHTHTLSLSLSWCVFTNDCGFQTRRQSLRDLIDIGFMFTQECLHDGD